MKTLTYTPRDLTGIASGGAHVPTVHLGSTLAASYLQSYFTVAVFMVAAVPVLAITDPEPQGVISELIACLQT